MIFDMISPAELVPLTVLKSFNFFRKKTSVLSKKQQLSYVFRSFTISFAFYGKFGIVCYLKKLRDIIIEHRTLTIGKQREKKHSR